MRPTTKRIRNRLGASRHLVGALALTIVALLLLPGASASADTVLCPPGSGDGQCQGTRGVAVDPSTSHVYVVDKGNNRVNVFEEDGSFLFSFGNTGTGPGQFTAPEGLAIDNDSTSPAYRDVYVVDTGALGTPRVQRFSPAGAFVLSFGEGLLRAFDPIAVGPGGTVYVGDNFKEGVGAEREIVRFSPAGVFIGSSDLPGLSFILDLAVNSVGQIYVARLGGGGGFQGVEKYDLTAPSPTLLATFDQASGLASSADHLFAAEDDNGFRVIVERDASDSVVRRFGYGELGGGNVRGLAVGTTGDLFVSQDGRGVTRLAPPPPGPLACCLSVATGNTKATLNGGVNPEGKATTYHFEYITQKQYEDNGNSWTGALNTPVNTPAGDDLSLYDVSAQIGCSEPTVPPQPTCLSPSTSYRYRLVASNTDGGASAEGQFTTKAPLELSETYATDATTDAVTLNATVNPLGIPATAYFEYVDEASYQADLAKGEGHDGFGEATKAPNVDAGKTPINAGSGEVPKRVATSLASLQPGITYHYRVVVMNPFTTVTGPERQVTTFPLPSPPQNACPNAAFRMGPSANLPDCRAYEMVSPLDKNGNDIKVLVQSVNFPARLDQSSADGDRFTYSSSTAFGDALSAPWSSQYIATRSEENWTSHAINAPRESLTLADNPIMRFDVPYKYFSADLSEGWLSQDADPPLDECAPEGFINLYHRNNETGDYEALVPTPPLGPYHEGSGGYRLEVQGVSSDGTRAVFRASTKLTEDAAKGVHYQLYEHVKDEGCGELRVVSTMPNGKASSVDASAGKPGGPAEYREGMVARAVSADGSRVFFTLNAVGPGPFYVRVNSNREQSEVSSGKCIEPEKACTLQISSDPNTAYWTAATDGSRAIYSSGGSLYEFDVDKALAGETANSLIAGGVDSKGGVAGASEDASRIFFVSTEQLNGEGEAGKRNLYLYDTSKSGAERYRLIATLEEAIGMRLDPFVVGSAFPIQNGVRLTADGSHLAFVSDSPLTGYDTKDASDGRPALQVYLYDVATDELGCISCNPSGARPAGRFFSFGSSNSRRVSAQMPPGESQSFAPRALSEDGNRLFFESFEALLPRDTNGKADAYEWQRAGSQQECDEVGAELYVPGAHGCLSLISTGQSPVDTEIADATPDGADVFIRTASSILPQDSGLVDIYDARVNGGQPQPPGIPAACEGEACQGPPAPPNDPTPASSAFEGAGNVKQAPASCRKPKVRRKGRCVAKKKQVAKHKAKKAKHGRRAGR